MTVIESIVKDLEKLPAPKLIEVAHFVQNFDPRCREERLVLLRKTQGVLSQEDGIAFEQAMATSRRVES